MSELTTEHARGPVATDEPLDAVGRQIVDSAFRVHKTLGPGLLEHVYEVCFVHELTKRGLGVQRQIGVPVVYDGIKFEGALRLDVLVEGSIICELKAVEALLPLHQAQLMTQLRLTGYRLGFLINFNSVLIKTASSASAFDGRH